MYDVGRGRGGVAISSEWIDDGAPGSDGGCLESCIVVGVSGRAPAGCGRSNGRARSDRTSKSGSVCGNSIGRGRKINNADVIDKSVP